MDKQIGQRPLRHVIEDFVLANEHTDEFARVFSRLSQDESWSLYAGRTQNRLARILLAEALRSARIPINDTFEFPLGGYLDYLEPVSIHCRLTDSDDALKIAGLRAAELQEWRAMQANTPVSRAEEIDFALRAYSQPTLLLVARVGLLLLEEEHLARVLFVTRTSISIRWRSLNDLLDVNSHKLLLVPLPLEPVRQHAETTAAISLIKAAAVTSRCERLFH